jgi:hypothetical protein
MKYATSERFEGHLESEDPRTPVTAAGGCTWPTVPAHRYLLVDPDATGIWSCMVYNGILIEKVTPGPAHDACQWNMVMAPWPIIWTVVWKRWDRAKQQIEWEVTINNALCDALAQATKDFGYWKCNQNFVFGKLGCTQSGVPAEMTNLQFLQVEHDKTRPPGGWPPLP